MILRRPGAFRVIDADAPAARRAAALVAVLTLAYVAFGVFVGGGYDPARDVAEALAIARDGARPLQGPLVAGAVHLGPWWFYALSLPLLMQPAWLGPALLTVLLAAAAFPLAFVAGRRLGDARLGLLWAVALALPGWGSFESVAFANTSIARAATLATLYLLLRADEAPRIGLWLLAGLAASIATHAHPSAAWLLLLALARAWRAPGVLSRHVQDHVAAMLAVAAGFALPFVPAFLAPSSTLGAAAGVAGANVSLANLARLPSIVASIAWEGPQAIFAALYPPSLAWPRNLGMLAGLIGILGALRAIPAALAGDRAARWGVGLTLGAAAFVALSRPVTPVYMAYSILPAYALAVAAGWRAIMASRPALVRAVILASLASSLAVGIGVVRAMRDGGGRVDGAHLADIVRGASHPLPLPDIWLHAASVDPLGRALCADPAPVYGALGYALDVFYALPLRLHCPGALPHFTEPRTDPGAPVRGHVGLAMRRFHDLGLVPARRIGGIGLTPLARVVAAPAVRDLPRDAAYPPHPYAASPAATLALAFDTSDGELVVVSNPHATWMPSWTTELSCDGRALAPATEDLVTRVYRCVDGKGGTHRWQARLSAADPGRIEIVTFLPRGR